MSVPRAWTLNSHPTLTVRRRHERPCPTRDSQLLNLLTFLPKSMSMPSTGSIRIDWCIGLLMPLLSLRKGIAVLSNCFMAVKNLALSSRKKIVQVAWLEKKKHNLLPSQYSWALFSTEERSTSELGPRMPPYCDVSVGRNKAARCRYRRLPLRWRTSQTVVDTPGRLDPRSSTCFIEQRALWYTHYRHGIYQPKKLFL